MSVNKVTFGDNTLIDLTEDTVTPETLAEGITAHDAAGNLIVGVDTPDVFVVNYDSSISKGDKTFAEITEAYNQGKVCILLRGVFVHYLVSIATSDITFGRVIGLNYNAVICNSANSWRESSVAYQSNSNKVDSITDSNKSSTFYYPSNKAVVDWIDSQLSVSSDIFIGTVTGSGTAASPFTCDKTAAELKEAYETGKLVIVIRANSVYTFAYMTSSYIYFVSAYTISATNAIMRGIRIQLSNNAIVIHSINLELSSDRKNTAYDLIKSSTEYYPSGRGVMEMLAAASEGSAEHYDVQFRADGSIEETLDYANKITTFNEDGTITESIYLSNSHKTVNKTYTFNADGSISMSTQWI